MKAALIQCDPQTGDLLHNSGLLLNAAKEAFNSGAVLCAAPAEALAGPDPGEWIHQADFNEACQASLDYMAQKLPQNLAFILGGPIFPNQAVMLEKGFWTALPENYYWKGLNIGFGNEQGVFDLNCDLILSLKAFPYSPGGQHAKEASCERLAEKTGAALLQPNLSGGFGELIYGGASFAAGADGRMFARAAAFKEDILIADLNTLKGGLSSYPSLDESQWLALTLGIRDFVRKSGADKAIIGLSGGMDSALVCCLAAEALGPDKVIAVMMPSRFSSEGSISDSIRLCRNLSIKPFELPIEKIMRASNESLTPILEALPKAEGELTQENLQPRVRSLLLMAIANYTGGLVLNTGNRSEALMGYSTLYGDSAGAVSVLGNVYKSRIYELARWLNKKMGREVIPEAILTKAPSAELRPNQKDTDSLPPYEALDPILAEITAGARPEGSQEKEFNAIRRRVFKSQFKRFQAPPALLAGEKAPPKWPVTGLYNIKKT